MPTVSFTHTEINPSHSEGSGGGTRSHTETEQNPTHAVGSGGGRRGFAEIEVTPTHIEGAGGGRKAFVLVEIPPMLPAPQVTTDPATGIGQVSTTINGTLDDDGGFPCECWFEWGLDTTYGTLTPPETKSIGESFSFELHGLVPGTTYHFRAVAMNVFGISHGADMEFTTDIQINRAHALSREEL
ncbi:hypothetical protein ES703_86056 [subsurface metagenome]